MMRTTRLRIVVPTLAEYTDIRDKVRGDHLWAEDYPTEGDVVMARLVLAAGEPPTSQNPLGPLQVVLEETGLAIGGIGFKGEPDDQGAIEIGYGLAPSAQGNGLATEAVLCLIDLARRLGLSALTAETDADNIASRRVLEKAGFTRSSGARADCLWWRLTLID
jgi:RimJ/RimL family protein N-acetyltransferase